MRTFNNLSITDRPGIHQAVNIAPDPLGRGVLYPLAGEHCDFMQLYAHAGHNPPHTFRMGWMFDTLAWNWAMPQNINVPPAE